MGGDQRDADGGVEIRLSLSGCGERIEASLRVDSVKPFGCTEESVRALYQLVARAAAERECHIGREELDKDIKRAVDLIAEHNKAMQRVRKKRKSARG